MARFTRIPETNLAGILGGIAGQAAGTVISTGNLTISKLQDKIDEICQDIATGGKPGTEDIQKIEKTLDTLDKTISGVEITVQGINTAVTPVSAATAALQVAINIIKYLPLPQISLVTSVSALQADLIQMLSELVAQIQQIILTILTIIDIILALLKKLRDLINKLRKILIAFKVFLTTQTISVSDQDKDVLKNLGVIGKDNSNIFSQLAGILNSRTTDIIWVGNYETIDTGSIVVENQVKAAESGTTINVPVGVVGNWVTTVYSDSKEKPIKPVGTTLIPKGWLSSFQGKCWSSKGTVSGLTSKVISWTEPVRSLGGKRQEPIKPETKEVNVFRINKGKFKNTNFNLQEANAIVLNSDEAYLVMLNFLQDLDQAPLSSNLKEQLVIEINPQEDQSEPGNAEEWYITRDGDKYKMILKASSISPKIATLRYIEVRDEFGVIVYEGTQTFATDPKVLFDETRVRLTQLLG